MKKVFLFLATCCITMGAMAQIQVKSDGNVYTNAKSVFINKQDSISGMGYGYTAYTLNGNGTIEIFNPADITIAVGGIFNHNYGKINVVNPFMSN